MVYLPLSYVAICTFSWMLDILMKNKKNHHASLDKKSAKVTEPCIFITSIDLNGNKKTCSKKIGKGNSSHRNFVLFISSNNSLTTI